VREEISYEVETCHRSETEWQPPAYFAGAEAMFTELARPYRFDGAFPGADAFSLEADPEIALPSFDDIGGGGDGAMRRGATGLETSFDCSFELRPVEDDELSNSTTLTPTQPSCSALPPAGVYVDGYFDW
jgi:hypothetical protein